MGRMDGVNPESVRYAAQGMEQWSWIMPHIGQTEKHKQSAGRAKNQTGIKHCDSD